MVKINVTMDSIFQTSRHTISNIEVAPCGDSYKITVPIPYIMFATALAGGNDSKLGLSIDVEYNNFFNATFKMDLPVSKFMSTGGGGGSVLPEGVTYEVSSEPHPYDGNDTATYGSVEVHQEISGQVPTDLVGLENITASIGNFGGEGNGVRIEVNDTGKIQLMTDNPDGLVEELKSNINEDGELVLNINSDDPSLPSSITIEKEYVDSFIAMSDDIIAILGAMSA